MDFAQRVTCLSQGGGLFADRFPFRGSLSSRARADEEVFQIGIRREIPHDGLDGTDVQPELFGEGWGRGVLQEVGATNLEVPVRGARGS